MDRSGGIGCFLMETLLATARSSVAFGFEANMNPLLLGIICGLVFATADVLLMLPLEIPGQTNGTFCGFREPVCHWVPNSNVQATSASVCLRSNRRRVN